MCPNLESYSTIKRSPSHSDNRVVSSNRRAAAADGDIGGKKEQRAAIKAPRRIGGIFHRQLSPRSAHKQCAMETAKIADSSVSNSGSMLCRSESSLLIASIYLLP